MYCAVQTCERWRDICRFALVNTLAAPDIFRKENLCGKMTI